MGKAARLGAQRASEKAAAARAAEKAAERRRHLILTSGGVVAVIAALVVFIAFQAASGGNSTSTTQSLAAADQPRPMTKPVVSAVEHVPAATLAKVGAGAVPAYQARHGSALKPGTGSPLTSGGKPEVLYIGAEYCPSCAATRWAMAVALSRFGAFTSPLQGLHSSPSGSVAPIDTLTFYEQLYRSPYLTFVPVENRGVAKSVSLQPTTTAQQALWNSYEPPSSARRQGSLFIDFGNKWAIEGPLYNPATLGGAEAGSGRPPTTKTWSQIASSLADPASPIALGVDGEANEITAAICSMTQDKPATVCSTPMIKTLLAKL